MKPQELTDSRTAEQNSKLWPMLRDVSRQVKWPVNGYTDFIGPEDWKDIFTAGMRKGQRVAAGIDGGWVMLGERTSKFKKAELSELIEFIYAFGASRNEPVVWSEDAKR